MKIKTALFFMILCVFSFPTAGLFVYANEPALAEHYDPSEVEVYEEERMYQAASVLVMDAETGRVLYETQGFTRLYPASVTKVMTALLVLENVQNLNERVHFSETAVGIPWYASHMRMQAGESLTVMDALYGIMLPSANETARALAEHVSGSVPAFVELMNRRAAELHAYDTRFVNPCGLPGDGQFVTAYDMALIMREAIRHPVFREIIGTAFHYIPPTPSIGEQRSIRNSNRMVRPAEPEFNPLIVGGKTGFTNAARHTLVSYARNDTHSIIISVLLAQTLTTFSDTAALAEHIFQLLGEGAFDSVYEPPQYENEEILTETEYEEPNIPKPYYAADEGTDEDYYPSNDDSMYVNDVQSSGNSLYVFDPEAILVASMSLALVFSSLIFILWIHKRKG